MLFTNSLQVMYNTSVFIGFRVKKNTTVTRFFCTDGNKMSYEFNYLPIHES